MKEGTLNLSILYLFCNQRPYSNLANDIAHEEDYESEDLDSQPRTEKMQHYKKVGPAFIWIFVGGLLFIMFGIETLYNHYTDVEHFRKPLPPPKDHPSPLSTPDTKFMKAKETKMFKMKVDAGLQNQPQFEIIDGKKRFGRFAGVNQPMDFI